MPKTKKLTKKKKLKTNNAKLVIRFLDALCVGQDGIVGPENYIVSNQIRCNHCLEQIFSASRHDMKYCTCGKVMVDGGQAYLRRGFEKDRNDYTELSIVIPKHKVEACVEAVEWGLKNGRNSLGIALSMLRACRDFNLLREEYVCQPT